jgi:hypothetical protein
LSWLAKADRFLKTVSNIFYFSSQELFPEEISEENAEMLIK